MYTLYAIDRKTLTKLVNLRIMNQNKQFSARRIFVNSLLTIVNDSNLIYC